MNRDDILSNPNNGPVADPDPAAVRALAALIIMSDLGGPSSRDAVDAAPPEVVREAQYIANAYNDNMPGTRANPMPGATMTEIHAARVAWSAADPLTTEQRNQIAWMVAIREEDAAQTAVREADAALVAARNADATPEVIDGLVRTIARAWETWERAQEARARFPMGWPRNAS